MSVHIKKIGQNIGLLAVASGIRGASVFIIHAYIGRMLGPTALGIFALSFAFTTILFRLVDLGLNIIIVREVARNKNLTIGYTCQVLSIRLVAIIFITILAYLLASLLYDSRVVIVIILLSLYWGFIYLSYVFFSIFRAHERMQYEATAFFISSVFVIISGIYIGQVTRSLINITSVFVIAGVIQFTIGLFFYVRQFGWPWPTYDPQLWSEILKKGAPLGVAVIFLMIYTRADTILLSLLTTNEQVGWYSAAYTLVTASGLVSTVIFSALFPRFSILYKHNRVRLRQLYLIVLGFMSVFGIVMGIIGTLLAGPIIVLIYGSGYEPTVAVFRVLAWVVVLLYTNNLCGVTLNAIDKANVTLVIVAIAALLNIVLNLLFIPRFGLMAAGATTLVTELTILVISLLLLENFFRKMPYSPNKQDGLLAQDMI